MHVSRRAAVAMLSTAALGGSAVTAVSAIGHDNGHNGNGGRHHAKVSFETPLAPSVPADPALHGVAAGGAPWALRSGSAELGRKGRIDVRVRGLVLPPPGGNGTAGPVTTVTASLYCGADSSTTAVGTTPSAPISQSGNARMAGRFTLPTKCLAPIVLVHPNGNAAAYIAASGFGS
jgi:hypothetical protein